MDDYDRQERLYAVEWIAWHAPAVTGEKYIKIVKKIGEIAEKVKSLPDNLVSDNFDKIITKLYCGYEDFLDSKDVDFLPIEYHGLDKLLDNLMLEVGDQYKPTVEEAKRLTLELYQIFEEGQDVK